MDESNKRNKEAEKAREESRRYIEAAGEEMIILIASVLRGMYGE